MIIYSLVLVHAFIKVDILLSYGVTTIMESIEADFFDHNDTITSDDGMNFAFGIVGVSWNETLDPDYGQLVARYRSWGNDF